MTVPDTFNLPLNASGDNVILPAVADKGYRVRQINCQNKHLTNRVEVTLKAGSTVIFGPIDIGPKNLFSFELGNDSKYGHSLNFPKNTDVVLELSAAVDVLVFGIAELS